MAELATYPTPSSNNTEPELAEAPVRVRHTVDQYQCYPGQIISLFTQVIVLDQVDGFELTIALPTGLRPLNYEQLTDQEEDEDANDGAIEAQASLEVGEDTSILTWQVDQTLEAGQTVNFILQVRVEAAEQQTVYETLAQVKTGAANQIAKATETIAITDIVTLSHKANLSYRYPGQFVQFETEVTTRVPLPGFTLEILLPLAVQYTQMRLTPNPDNIQPVQETLGGIQHLIWTFDEEVPAGVTYRIQLDAVVTAPQNPTDFNTVLETRAVLTAKAQGNEAIFALDNAPITIAALSHVAERYENYPGDTVTFYTQVGVQPPFTLTVTLGNGLTLSGFKAPDVYESIAPEVETYTNGTVLTWDVPALETAGGSHDYCVTAKVDHAPVPVRMNVAPTSGENFVSALLGGDRDFESDSWRIDSQAEITVRNDDQISFNQVDEIILTILRRGRYIQHLPDYFKHDEFMGRYLMLFERFWGPIEDQIDYIDAYFDPGLVPSELLPWLASWVNLAQDDDWTEAQWRKLLKRAIPLYRVRGTKEGLVEMIKLYTGYDAKITEHRGNNFYLDNQSRLGEAIALGTNNRPNTFTVTVQLPPIEGDTPEEQAYAEGDWRQEIIEIIEAEKPAYTDYTLKVEPPAKPILKDDDDVSNSDQYG
ncbi:MAG: phage tail protein [Chloroflexota bacterium]